MFVVLARLCQLIPLHPTLFNMLLCILLFTISLLFFQNYMMSISNCLPLCIQRNNTLHIATENVNEHKLTLHLTHYVEVLHNTYILNK